MLLNSVQSVLRGGNMTNIPKMRVDCIRPGHCFLLNDLSETKQVSDRKAGAVLTFANAMAHIK